MNRHPKRRLVRSRQYIADRIGAKHCDFALMKPFEARRMQPRHLHACNGADSFGPAQLEAARPQQHHIAFANFDVLGALGGFEIFGKNRVARLDPFNLPNARNIEKHATRDYTVACDFDRAFMRTLEINFSIIESVVHLALVEMMAEGVEMRGRKPMRFNRKIVGTSPRAEWMTDI